MLEALKRKIEEFKERRRREKELKQKVKEIYEQTYWKEREKALIAEARKRARSAARSSFKGQLVAFLKTTRKVAKNIKRSAGYVGQTDFTFGFVSWETPRKKKKSRKRRKR